VRTIIYLILLALGLGLILVHAYPNTCFKGILTHPVTCVYNGRMGVYVESNNAVIVVHDGAESLLDGRGYFEARNITIIPPSADTKSFGFNNVTSIRFDQQHPLGGWINMTLAGNCNVFLNASLLGAGYFSIWINDSRGLVGSSSQTTSYIAHLITKGPIMIRVEPALPLACPCIQGLVVIEARGNCTLGSSGEPMVNITTSPLLDPLLILALVLVASSSIAPILELRKTLKF